MKAFLKELFAYNRDCNTRLIAKSLELEDRLPERSQKLFSHVLNAHGIWNARILNQKPPFGVWQIFPVAEWQTIDISNFENSLSVIDDDDLHRELSYVNSRGDAFVNSVRDILFHIVNHSTYHRAQIAADFRENGLEPLVTDYIFYKR